MTTTPTVSFEEIATDLPEFLRAEIPATHTIVARCGDRTATGATKAEAAHAAVHAYYRTIAAREANAVSASLEEPITEV